jgi:transcriptional regulator with XRE-family HTH domain
MLAKHYGRLIKDQRLRKGLKQNELAAAARVSRAVLSRLEQGGARPVQTDTLERLLRALQIEPQAFGRAALDDARKLAHLEEERKLERRRNQHLRLAVELADAGPAAAAMVARARTRVDLWRRNRSCSAHYIERWSELLALPPRKLARAMAALGDWEDALFQNSPWSWAWT